MLPRPELPVDRAHSVGCMDLEEVVIGGALEPHYLLSRPKMYPIAHTHPSHARHQGDAAEALSAPRMSRL
jgi:hypothetical protein